MATKEYRWRGLTYRISDEDLARYPGAEPLEPEKKAAQKPKNKAKHAAENKSKEK